MTIQIVLSPQVAEQLEIIRREGLHNMSNSIGVQRRAHQLEFWETVVWIEENDRLVAMSTKGGLNWPPYGLWWLKEPFTWPRIVLQADDSHGPYNPRKDSSYSTFSGGGCATTTSYLKVYSTFVLLSNWCILSVIMTGKYNDDDKRMTLRIPVELHRLLKKIARQERRSVNAQIIVILEAWAKTIEGSDNAD